MWPFSTIRKLRHDVEHLLEFCDQQHVKHNNHIVALEQDLAAARKQLEAQRKLLGDGASSVEKLINISRVESALIDRLSDLVMTCRTHFDLIQNECTPKSRAETRRMRNLALHMMERIDAEMNPAIDDMEVAAEPVSSHQSSNLDVAHGGGSY